MSDAAVLEPRQVLRLSKVLTLVPFDRSTIDRWEKAGKFPKRVTLVGRSIGWYADEIAAWLQTRERRAS